MDGQTFHWEMLSPEEVQKVLACGDAGQLSKLDPEYLCAYAAEDTDSTYLLLSEILEPALNKFPELREFHSTYGTALVEMICIQRLTGIQLNVEQLRKHESDLIKGLTAAQAELEADERVRAGVEAWHGVLLDNVNKQMPTDKFVPKKYPKEPARKFNKDGTLTTVYARWEANCRIVDYEPLRYNDKWTRWWETYLHVKEKVDEFWTMDLEERKDKGLFNFFSNEHRRWFFYDFMQFPISVLTDKEQASTSGNALLGFGDLGKKFEKVDDLKKELQFVESLKNASDMETGIYHPRLKTPGTHTGRLSGDGGFNLQNPPKSRGFLEVFAPRNGRALVDWDATALEPTVLAEVSRDPGLLSVYGPNAKKGQDIYLMVGAALPGIGNTLRSAGYDPDKPDPEVVGRVKKEQKDLRNVCKIAHLCLAEDTLVRVKHKAWTPIQDVQAGDEVWDGECWVRTSGSVLTGLNPCVTLEGVSMTPAHKVLTKEKKWYECWSIYRGTSSAQCFQPNLPGASWADVWRVVRSFFRSKA
jgi:hypothetical protein